MEINHKELFEKIAENHGVSEESVYIDMQEAISAGYYSDDPLVQEYWQKIAPDGKIPAPEYLIEILAKEIKNNEKI